MAEGRGQRAGRRRQMPDGGRLMAEAGELGNGVRR